MNKEKSGFGNELVKSLIEGFVDGLKENNETENCKENECCEDIEYDLSYVSNGNQNLKKVMIFYVDIGQLPCQKGMELVMRRKKSIESFLKKLPKTIGVLFIPVRATSHVEIFELGD